RENSYISDTISCINKIGLKSYHLVTTQHALFKFSSNGILLSTSEPFKNRFSNSQRDSSMYYYNYRKEVRLVTGKNYYYTYLNIYISNADTFNSSPRIPVKQGNIYFLIKLNEQDSIIWMKPLYKGKESVYTAYSLFHDLDIDTVSQILSFNIIFSPTYFEPIFKPSLNNGGGGFVFKINADGQIIKEDSFANTTFFFRESYDYIKKQWVSLGQINGTDLRFRNFIPSNLYYNYFLAIVIFDLDYNPIFIQPLVINYFSLSSNIQINNFPNYSDFVDSRGKVTVSGAFWDSIYLPCQNLYSTLNDTNFLGYPMTDGFSISIESFKRINRIECRNYLSPSTKYLWDSTGIYIDTLQNSFGCDSILEVNLQILQSTSSIDSMVCNAMKSFSQKYIWDSSGIYFDTIPNSFACDSIIKLSLLVGSNRSFIDTTVKYTLQSPSGKFNWDSSATYYDTLTNSIGCDSIIRINLAVLSNRSQIDTFNCYPIQSFSNTFGMNQSGHYLDTIPNSKGGDSLISIHFTIGSNSSTIDTSFCNQIISPSGRYMFSSSGIYLDTLINCFFCDSIIEINFTRTSSSDTLYYTNCDSLLSPSGKFYLDKTGLFTDSLLTVKGCDSIVYIYYTRPVSNSQFSVSTCDSVVSPSGKYVYTLSGNYSDTLINQFGCDSVIEISVTKSTNKLTISKSNDIDCLQPFTQLIAEGALKYTWSPIEGLNDAHIPNPIASPIKSITYYVIASDSFDCEFTDSIFLNVNRADSLGFFPNVITPNGDGKNDCLPLNSLNEFKEANFFVYNRWGNLIYESNNPELCWQGIAMDGQAVTEGVYYYILKGKTKCDENFTKTGSITVIR
ncbi:MAG: gliding motility-associated C-terminal domain-containing protein, partial [Bacteroidia bacterium]|nr:gliding motility-associated C-terminal domain-containing protein [Bacteroidia bacterium]